MDIGQAPERKTLVVEARYWPMNLRVTNPSIFQTPQRISLAGECAVVASERRHPFDHYGDSARNILHLEFDRVAQQSCASHAPPHWRLARLFVRIWGIGILSSYAVFEITVGETAEVDAKCASAVNVVDSLIPDLKALITELDRRGAVKLGADLMFGVPATLDRANRHSAHQSYRYSNYVFIGTSEALLQALGFYDVGPHEDRPVVKGAPVYVRWAHYLLDVTGEDAATTMNLLEDRVSMDLLPMSEAIAYDNGSECNRGFLDAILAGALVDVEIDAEQLRETTLFHHRLLLDVRLWRSLLDQKEQVLHKRVCGALLLSEGKENFEASDNVLRYAVDSLDVREQRDADRLLAIALGVFTALTTFSAAADLNALLRDDGSMGFGAVLTTILNGPFSLRTVLLAMATTGAAVALMFLAADRAVRRRIKRTMSGLVQRARRIARLDSA